MAATLIGTTPEGIVIYSGSEAERLAMTVARIGTIFLQTGGNKYEANGAGGWNPISISGAATVYGLARNSVRISSGAYNTTEILGYRVLVAGTGTLTLSPVGGATDIVLTSAEVISMGFQPMPEHLDSITLGNADMEVLVYTP
jgi:hypothetical protein